MDKITNLFHDCGYLYLSTIEPDIDEAVTVRLRTVKDNVTKAWVEISHDSEHWNAYELYREKEDQTGHFTFFAGVIPGQKEMFRYRFRAKNESPRSEVYYTRHTISKEEPVFDGEKPETNNCWTLLPGYHTPDWAKGILWYSVMPDAFYNGDITNDEPISGENLSNSWNMPQHNLMHKYGGDLKGIEKKLDYIRELGCEAVFMDPIFKSSQNAGYGPEFYKQIENSFGNRQALIELAKAVHDRGMYYMIDVVLTFVAVLDIWYNKNKTNPLPGAAQDWTSEFHEFFYFTGEEGDTASYKSNWGGLSLNFNSEKLRDLIYRNKDSYMQYYCDEPFHVDAVRFDCGGDISGTREDGSIIPDWEILGEMRPYLRAINPEIMMLSEYSFTKSVEKGVWDSRWNLEFVNYALKYMQGEVTESFLFNRFDSEIYNVPRAFAHCQYNSMADHDRPRITNVEPYAFRAFQLIHMTQIGAPCIYYGDENRIEREKGSFYAMEWNEADWDYGVLHDTKALTELRKKYSALRTGIIKYICVDDDNHLMAYARMDEESTVITVASRNASSRVFAIDVQDLGEVDGTVFIDWFTGKRYVAKQGYIDVDLPAGGTIFVKGEKSSSYKGGFAIRYSDESEAQVTIPKDSAICIEGKGAFVYTEVFNTFQASALLKKTKGTGTLLALAEETPESAFVGAVVSGDKLAVYARKTAGEKVRRVAYQQIVPNSYVRIQREGDNQFDVSVTRTPGGYWKEVVTGLHVELPNHVKVGMTARNGKAVFEDICIKYATESVLWDDFKNGYSAMFDFTPEMNLKYTKAGLTVTPQNGNCRLLTNAYDEDWTFKTEVCFQGSVERDYAGIISWQDEDTYVAAGRMYLEGSQVFFIGRANAGKLVVYHTVPDINPDRRATVQLQRIGTTYSAIYSYDGKTWKQIGENVVANFCAERTGLVVNGENSAVFSYATFGNAIHDSISYNTPRTPGMVLKQMSLMAETVKQPVYEIVSGDWSYADEGYIQTSKRQAQLGISNKIYTDFKIDGTYVIDEGKGYIGFEFAKNSHDSVIGDGYLLKLDTESKLSLERNGECLTTISVSERFGKEVRLCVENRNGVFAVFAGLAGEPILVINDFERTSGYLAYMMEGVTGHINNSLAASYDAGFYLDAAYEKLKFTEQGMEKNWQHTHAFANPFGIGVTDFEAGVRVKIQQFGNPLQNPYVGLYFCSPEGKFSKDKALALVVDSNYRLLLKNGDEVLASSQLEKGRNEIKLRIVMLGGVITAYTDQMQEAAIIYERGAGNGGVVSVCANMAAVTFEQMTLMDLTAELS